MPAKPATTTSTAAQNGKPAMFDLDALEREDAPEPFEFTAGGEQFVVTDIKDRDWHDLAAMADTPMEWMRVYLGDDFTRFEKLPRGTVPAWKLEALVKAINSHFGMVEVGESAGSSGS